MDARIGSLDVLGSNHPRVEVEDSGGSNNKSVHLRSGTENEKQSARARYQHRLREAGRYDVGGGNERDPSEHSSGRCRKSFLGGYTKLS